MAVLDWDPDLADGLSEDQVAEARKVLLAPRLAIPRGRWNAPAEARSGCLGLLVIKGSLTRRVMLGDTVCAELVGPGDLLRPWDRLEGETSPTLSIGWRVEEDAQLVLLSDRFASTAARWPPVTSALMGRLMRRANTLALAQAIGCTTGLDTRLLTLFRHFAERWGRVRPDGVLVPLPLTHETIGLLIGARRPSVSTALKLLEREGLICREGRSAWLLAHRARAEAPAEMARAA